MSAVKPNSLGDQISKKISVWILILISVIISALFSVSFLLSKKMFNNQVNIWNTAVPRYTVTNLIDSDYFSIQREIAFLKTTGLFSSFIITDNQRKKIAQFGSHHLSVVTGSSMTF